MSIVKHKDQRVAIFIDTQNLYHSAKNIYRSKVNFDAVVKKTLGDRKLVRAISYVVTTETGEEQSFFEALGKIGIEVKTKDLQIFFGGAKKADWDVGMAIDAIKLSAKVDVIVLATGDGDFVPLVEYVRSQGCQVECIAFGRSSSSRLREAVDDFIDMDENPREYLIGFRPNPKIRRHPRRAPGTDTDEEADI
jgi:uncharacterized LabA/DUF88 family protein